MIKVGHAISPMVRLILQDRRPGTACSKSVSSHYCFLSCEVLIVTAVILTYRRSALTAMLETLKDTPDHLIYQLSALLSAMVWEPKFHKYD